MTRENNNRNSKSIELGSIYYNNITIISDDITGWNNGYSASPSIVIDSNEIIHAVWADDTNGAWGSDKEIMYAFKNGTEWTNITVISDDSTQWNNDSSNHPSIAVDINGTIHIVWQDSTNGVWGSDTEIMYSFNNGSGWSNATVISDDIINWNDGRSSYPSLAVDINGTIHVVWNDDTDGIWGTDEEIMYIANNGTGWSDIMVISDDGTNWNDGDSYNPSIAVDETDKVHVVWDDTTDGAWSTDWEIMYASNDGSGWSNATVISDDITNWNDGESSYPSLAVDINGTIHVVWKDDTDGIWGTDEEIMYIANNGTGWSDITVISDDANQWNNGPSYLPSIAVDYKGIIHVVWSDNTKGIWGTDPEVMYTFNNGSGWSNFFIISDNNTNWNRELSWEPSIAVDNKGIIHVVWEDDSDGIWGNQWLDWEIMYSSSKGYKIIFTNNSDNRISLGNTYIFFMLIGISCIFIQSYKKYKKRLLKT